MTSQPASIHNKLTEKQRKVALKLAKDLEVEMDSLLGDVDDLKTAVLEKKNKVDLKQTLENIVSIKDS
jgi:hypothetical protein